MLTNDKELGPGEGLQEIGIELPQRDSLVRTGAKAIEVGVVAPRHETYCSHCHNAGVGLRVGQTDPGSERITYQRYAPGIDARLRQEPIQSPSYVGLLTPAVVMVTTAAPCTPEVEA